MMKRAVEIGCVHCGTWFPLPILFDDDMLKRIDGYPVSCPQCDRVVLCHRDQVRYATHKTGQGKVDSD